MDRLKHMVPVLMLLLLLWGGLTYLSGIRHTTEVIGEQFNYAGTAQEQLTHAAPDNIHCKDKREEESQKEVAEAVSAAVIDYSTKDYEALLKIVEAEAGVCDLKGKILVANVVINRVNDSHFPDSANEVIYQRRGKYYQFSPVQNGKIEDVDISEETIQAVEQALQGTDYSQGALFFAARSYSDQDNMDWFDNNLRYLFSHDGHEFFTTK